jgi:multidrug efflux pump subunit AcrA (membrane-fusion protein)
MMKFAMAFLIAAAAFACNGCDNPTVASSSSAAPPPAIAPPPAAALAAAKTADILSVLTVEHQVDLTAQRDGVVTSITKDEGSTVKAADVLGQLDDRSLQMELV